MKPQCLSTGVSCFRSDGDLNPGYRYQYTSLAGKRLRPLGHRSFFGFFLGNPTDGEGFDLQAGAFTENAPQDRFPGVSCSHPAQSYGWRGIRTPGGLHLNGFQDRRLRPLGHPSRQCLDYNNSSNVCQECFYCSVG